MKMRRGRLDIQRWVAKYALMRTRLHDSWMDLRSPLTADCSDEQLAVGQVALMREYQLRGMENQFPTDREQIIREVNVLTEEQHRGKFPFSDNLFTLLFIIASELSESQRQMLTAHLHLKGVTVENYTWTMITQLFVELLCMA